LIVLTSPGGTEAILHPGNRPENTQLAGGDDEFRQWKLLSLKTWGEFPVGEWTLSIQDKRTGNYESCVDLPWEYTYTRQGEGTNSTLTCRDFDEVADCNDSSEVDPKIVASSNLLESCCACGGGKDATTVKPILHKWKLVVYGHIIESEDDLIFTEDSYQESTPDTSNNSDGDLEGDLGEEGDDGSLTADDDTPHGETSAGWDDKGNSGEFVGGGGTAWWAEGWTGSTEGDAFNYSARTDLYLGLSSGGWALLASWGALLPALLFSFLEVVEAYGWLT
jgi:Proprotein convertase P-domain